MYSAVVMAGYNNKRAVKRYSKIVAENYGEKFIETGYKPLKVFRSIKNGKEERKPLIQYTLEPLFSCDLIHEIVIVGHQMLLEQRLRGFLNQFHKPCVILNQNTQINNEIIDHFNIMHHKVKHNSIAGNLIKGYSATTAFKEKKHALFVASDSPMTRVDFIETFLEHVSEYEKNNTLIFPAVLIQNVKDKLGRNSLKLINDTKYLSQAKADMYGRQGFRLSALMYANPHYFDLHMANVAYSLRKCLNPKIQLKILKITRSLGYPNLYSKYFLRKDLSIRETEKISSKFFNGKVKVIPMIGEEATYDYDGTEREFKKISEFLQTPPKPSGLNKNINKTGPSTP
jgi:hypothetical protein